MEKLPQNARAPKIILEPMAENWDGLYEKVLPDYTLANREEVLRILRDGSIGGETKKRRLQQLDNGNTWGLLVRKYMPELRVATLISFKLAPQPITQCQAISAPAITVIGQDILKKAVKTTAATAQTSVPAAQTYVGQTSAKEQSRSFPISIKTNMLEDLGMIPNIGMEFYLGKGFSIGLDWRYAWWINRNKDFFWCTYGGDLFVRKYFGRQAEERPLSGHHVGLYGQVFTYDFEVNGKGIMGAAPGKNIFDQGNYGVGIDYGYSLPISDRFNIDFSVGIGYWGGRYLEYTSQDGHYVWQTTKQRHYVGPTKAEISLVLLLGGNKAASAREKGGRR